MVTGKEEAGQLCQRSRKTRAVSNAQSRSSSSSRLSAGRDHWWLDEGLSGRCRLHMGHVTLTAATRNTGVSSMPRRCGMADSAVLNRAFRHIGFFYRTEDEYAATVTGFLRDGLAAGEPALAAIPPARIALVRDALGADAA